jgi:hypothetical protein
MQYTNGIFRALSVVEKTCSSLSLSILSVNRKLGQGKFFSIVKPLGSPGKAGDLPYLVAKDSIGKDTAVQTENGPEKSSLEISELNNHIKHFAFQDGSRAAAIFLFPTPSSLQS